MIKKIQCQPLTTDSRVYRKNETKFTSLSSKTADLIANNKIIGNILDYSGKNSSLVNSVFVFGLSTMIRPLTTMALPTDKEDKKYSAVRSIATGIAELVFSVAAFLPLSGFTNKCCDKLKTKAESVYVKSPETLKAFNTLINRGSRFIIMPIQVFFLFALIPPIVDKLFKNDGGNKNVR